jgi:hypothetical protein
MSIDLGDVASWFSAAGTVGALGVSLYLLRAEFRRRIGEQASLMSAWIGGDPNKRGDQFTVTVSNGSQQPIYALRVFLTAGDGSQEQVHTTDLVPPGVKYQPPSCNVRCR